MPAFSMNSPAAFGNSGASFASFPVFLAMSAATWRTRFMVAVGHDVSGQQHP